MGRNSFIPVLAVALLAPASASYQQGYQGYPVVPPTPPQFITVRARIASLTRIEVRGITNLPPRTEISLQVVSSLGPPRVDFSRCYVLGVPPNYDFMQTMRPRRGMLVSVVANATCAPAPAAPSAWRGWPTVGAEPKDFYVSTTVAVRGGFEWIYPAPNRGRPAPGSSGG